MDLFATLLADGWSAVLRGDTEAASRLFRHVAEEEPRRVDAWNGLGATFFEKGDIKQSVKCYERALTLAKVEFGGTFPSKLPWTEQNKPTLRALKGIGLNHFRAGALDEARRSFEELLKFDPADKQGVRFLIEDLKKGKKLWKK